MCSVTTAHVPMDHRQNSVTSFIQSTHSRLLSSCSGKQKDISANSWWDKSWWHNCLRFTRQWGPNQIRSLDHLEECGVSTLSSNYKLNLQQTTKLSFFPSWYDYGCTSYHSRSMNKKVYQTHCTVQSFCAALTLHPILTKSLRVGLCNWYLGS